MATVFAALLLAGLARADSLRIATFNADLERDGPGLLLRDILRGKDEQVAALAKVVGAVAPDILLLQGVDYDMESRTLDALAGVLAAAGRAYPHRFARRPNTGWQTGHDMDGDGRLGEPEDAQGFGRFAGQGGMAILSRVPLDPGAARDFSDLLWRDLPGATLPQKDDAPFPSEGAQAALRLANVAQWVVPVAHPAGRFDLLAFHATAPVFDGPEDRNGLRNRDQLRFWRLYLDGAFGPPPEGRFVLLGSANQDPQDGEGLKDGIRALLADPRVSDPRPIRAGAAPVQPDHRTDARLDTVDWPAPGPGALRVSYVLPSRGWRVVASGVHWPPRDTPEGAIAAAASRHRMVWVDLEMGE
ncbi:endonuclease/exonuclease/phosphatase family protein [Roseovarius spongiae]|uniref:Endonuclease/exonuclease/phosphatase family protein n=1 Tax=Roseovarius spongiae TaxID=2320272 RepID=A0A3A8ASC5_9RHOB|nr:endonuclease/exonuclease/phosphatase family protein [Roseovarius spongiae]